MIWLIMFILAAICFIAALVIYIVLVRRIGKRHAIRGGWIMALYGVLTIISKVLFWISIGGATIFVLLPWIIDCV